MEFRILGPLQVLKDGAELPLGGARPRTLLALLLLNVNRVVSTDRLIEELWDGEPPPTATTALQGYVSQLRKLLEPGRARGEAFTVLVSHPSGYSLRLDSDDLDAARFERLVEDGRQALARGRRGEAARLLRQGLALWRGPALADFTFRAFAQGEIGALEELRLAALEERVAADLALGRHAELVGELQALIGDHPLRERPRGQLMVALYRSGRQAEALEVFQEARRALVEELGIEPSPFLQELERSILNQDPALTHEAPRGRATAASLPMPRNPLVGRERVLAEVCELALRPEVRLLTLTGVGGAGKSRLALEAARALDREFEGGACFVQLAPVAEPTLVLFAIAKELSVGEAGSEPLLQTLARELSDRELFLVLDNFEQLLGAAPVLAELLAQVPGLTIAVTSRAALRLSSEHLYPVPPLSREDAITLFVERMQAVRPDFRLTPASAPILAEICARLDRLPLALELAAARGRLLSPDAMLERLEHRLELLTRGASDLPARQQTLRAAIDWSYDLLVPGERQLLAHLSVFSGGCTVDAAEAVCVLDGAPGSGVLEGLAALVDQSLLLEYDDSRGEARLAMLETIREYALERLHDSGETEAVRRRLAGFFCGLAERAAADLRGGQQQVAWLDRLEGEHGNLRAAFGYARDAGDTELLARLAAGLAPFWALRAYLSEGRSWLEEALSAGAEQPDPLRARVLAGASVLARMQGDSEAARSFSEEWLTVNRRLGDLKGTAHSLSHLASVVADQGDVEHATALLEESRELSREAGDTRGVARAIVNLGNLGLIAGDFERAASLCEESLALQRELGDEEGMAISLFNLGTAQLHRDHRDRAREAFEESLLRSSALGGKELIAYCLEGLAAVWAHQGQAERSARLLGCAEVLREETGALHQPHERERYERTVGLARELLDEDEFDGAWRDGRELTIEQSIVEAGLPAPART